MSLSFHFHCFFMNISCKVGVPRVADKQAIISVYQKEPALFKDSKKEKGWMGSQLLLWLGSLSLAMVFKQYLTLAENVGQFYYLH